MSEMSELTKLIKQTFHDKYPDARWSSIWGDLDGLEIPGWGKIKELELVQHGDEDCTGRIQQIFELAGRTFAKDGMYYSHVGTEWDECEDVREVRKVSKTVVVTEWA